MISLWLFLAIIEYGAPTCIDTQRQEKFKYEQIILRLKCKYIETSPRLFAILIMLMFDALYALKF